MDGFNNNYENIIIIIISVENMFEMIKLGTNLTHLSFYSSFLEVWDIFICMMVYSVTICLQDTSDYNYDS